MALYKKIGLLSFHGPMVKDLTKNKNRNFQSFLDLATSHEGMNINFAEKQVIRHGQGRGILGVVDGSAVRGIESEEDIAARKKLLRSIGYKL